MTFQATRLGSCAGLQIDVRYRLTWPKRPVVIYSVGYGTALYDGEPHNTIVETCDRHEINIVQYLYPERIHEPVTTDLLISSGYASLNHVYDWVVAQDYADIWLFGMSFGGNISCEFALNAGKRVRRLMLVNPITDYIEYRQNQLGEAAITAWQDTGTIVLDYNEGRFRSSSRFLDEARRQTLRERLAQMSNPVTIFQGAKDPCISVDSVMSIAARNPNISVRVLQDADHGVSDAVSIRQLRQILDDLIGS